MTFRARWLGRVAYSDAQALQQSLFERSTDNHLLLLEHPPIYTLGVRAKPAHVLVDPESVGAQLQRTNRGGDVTYHGPGQLVGYPIVSVAGKGSGNMADTAAYVTAVEQLIMDVLADVGLTDAHRLDGLPGVWVDNAKICAIGVRLSRGRTMHGFALNVDPDLTMFDHIVPCGIPDRSVTSLAALGVIVTMAEVVDAVVLRAKELWGSGEVERQDLAWRVTPEDLSAFSRGEVPADLAGQAGRAGRVDAKGAGVSVRMTGRLAEAGVTQGLSIGERKPAWLRAKARIGPEYLELKRTMRELSLVTVCEEAGCPNIYECWADRTATFMINGDRCTRACGFCLVDTRQPEPLPIDEPERVAEAVARMDLAHAVITTVARDDLDDGGAAAFAETIGAIRERTPSCDIEVLISDCKGDPVSLERIFDARPDVVNHNIETVVRLQRAVRPSAGYARSLAVLARAKSAGLTTKSGMVLGLGERDEEIVGAMADLAGVGVDIVTLGQYLRPTEHHLPVERWIDPAGFEMLAAAGRDLGIGHVEASPLTRSSYHARQAASSVIRV